MELDLHSYRKQIAVVPQQSILFTGTLRENITYGSESISEEQLWNVIRAANLEEVVQKLPDGLDTMITEHGGKSFWRTTAAHLHCPCIFTESEDSDSG